MRLLVVGAGSMGRWLARSVDADVTFADADPAVAHEAAAAQGAEYVATDTDETFDAVCLAVPMSVVEAAVGDYAGLAERAVFDVSGEMAGPLAAMREHAPDRERASLHPLFAPENAPGNVALVADKQGAALDRVLDDLADAGNHLFETTPEEHDTAMETVQAGAHTAVLAYALAAEEVREEFHTPVSAGLEAVVETVTGGNARVYAEIQDAFDGADEVAEMARRIADADGAEFETLYGEADTAGRPGPSASEGPRSTDGNADGSGEP